MQEDSNQLVAVGQRVFVDDVDIVAGTYFQGGWATVTKVWRGANGEAWISIEEIPGTSWLWDGDSGLASRQADLEDTIRAGRRVAHDESGALIVLDDRSSGS